MMQYAYKKLLDVIYFGYGILIFAAIINWLGKYLGMKSWYDLFGAISFFDLGPINIFWLIVAYPFSLGLSIHILNVYKVKIIK